MAEPHLILAVVDASGNVVRAGDLANLAVRVNVVAGGAGDGSILDGVSSSIKATVLDLTSSNPLTTAIVDATGAQITSFGGGVQYTEGDVDPSITGTATLMEGAGNTLLPIQGTIADGLLVNLGGNNDVTVTGTVTVTATDLDVRNLVFATDKVDASGSSVTVSNAGGASAVNIQDGGNSITVDGAVAATQSGAWSVTLLAGSATIGSVNVTKQDETPGTPGAATVGVASAEAIPANASRKGLHARNTSTSGQRISLAFDGGTAVLDSGYTLYPEDVFDMDEFDFTVGNVVAIASAASARLSFQDWT